MGTKFPFEMMKKFCGWMVDMVELVELPKCLSGKESACLCRRQETWLWSLGQEDPLEEEMATHSNTLAWEIPWTEEPGGLQSMGSQRVGHDWVTLILPERGGKERDVGRRSQWLPLRLSQNPSADNMQYLYYPITSWQIEGGKVEEVIDLFGGSNCRWWLQPWN